MRPSVIGTEQRNLQQYLQDLICSANTVEEVDILVEVLMSLQYAARPVSVRVSPTPLRIIHGRAGRGGAI
ncbi:MAG TPA: hypothetical protein VN881_10435 [Candidatus Acidoferrales bacterium]|jgi:hypothetical protein|nr:hypothetical protein [Candidatus Acidoferrales bacterium]